MPIRFPIVLPIVLPIALPIALPNSYCIAYCIAMLLGLGGNQGGGGWGGRVHVVFTAKSFGNTLSQAPGVVLKKPMSFLQPSHLETHWA